MQTDRWLMDAESEHEECCSTTPHSSPVARIARASVWIDPVLQQHISTSYVEHKQRGLPQDRRQMLNPNTPIPPRASAYPPVRVRSRYSRIRTIPSASNVPDIPTIPQKQGSDVPDIPTRPQLNYESSKYEVKSSVFSPSLVSSKAARLSIDELDTIPSLPRRQHTPSQQKYSPAVGQNNGRVQFQFISSPLSPSFLLHTSNSMKFQNKLVLPASYGIDKNKSLFHNPLDSARWWLLYSGRIEFLLWLCAAIVLITATCLLLFAILLSTGSRPL